MRQIFAGLLIFTAAIAGAVPQQAFAQSTSAIVVSSCGTPPATYPVGANRQVTQDTTGKLCDAGGGGGGGGAVTIANGADIVEGTKGDTNTAGTVVGFLHDVWVALTTGPVPVTVSSSTLPTGASTSALQTTGNTSLSTIAGAVGSSIPAGSATIGGINNFPATVSTGTGAQDASTPRAAVAVDAATIAGSPPSTVLLAQPVPGTTNGLTTFYLTAANSTNATNVKASAGTLYDVELSNNSATLAYVSFYNTAGTPTCGTSIVGQAIIPANSTSGAGWVGDSSLGKAFSTGIGICVATGIAGTGSVAASAYTIWLGYK